MRTTGMETTCRRRSGFTLIEMLVVIVIIVILMGVVFKLSKGAMAKATYGKEMKRVAILRTLIEEYHAEYNIYPPVPVYTDSSTHKQVQPVNFIGTYPVETEPWDWYKTHNYSSTGNYFIFGLMSFFVDRGEYCNVALGRVRTLGSDNPINVEWGNHNDKPEQGAAKIPAKDSAFVKRVTPIVRQIYDGEKHVAIDPNYSEPHSLGFKTHLYDSWSQEYVYISKPPHTTYLIFSKGPDGKYDEKRPGDRAADANRDNIYGNLGDK